MPNPFMTAGRTVADGANLEILPLFKELAWDFEKIRSSGKRMDDLRFLKASKP